MLASKTPVLPNTKENPTIPYYYTYKMICLKGHIKSQPGRCMDCKRAWDKTPSGRYSKMKRNLRSRMKVKIARVQELEKELARYEQKDSNRAGAR